MKEDLGDKTGSSRCAPEAASASPPSRVTIPIAPLELRYHSAMPGWCKIVGLKIKAVPECEGGGFCIAQDQAQMIVAAPGTLAALHCFIADERFQVAVGGNPNVVERMLADARVAYARATGASSP